MSHLAFDLDASEFARRWGTASCMVVAINDYGPLLVINEAHMQGEGKAKTFNHTAAGVKPKLLSQSSRAPRKDIQTAHFEQENHLQLSALIAPIQPRE